MWSAPTTEWTNLICLIPSNPPWVFPDCTAVADSWYTCLLFEFCSQLCYIIIILWKFTGNSWMESILNDYSKIRVYPKERYVIHFLPKSYEANYEYSIKVKETCHISTSLHTVTEGYMHIIYVYNIIYNIWVYITYYMQCINTHTYTVTLTLWWKLEQMSK